MSYFIGVIFVLLGVWQFVMTKRSFSNLKKNGNKNTSPFVMFSLWSSLVIGICFFSAAGYCFFY
ncbi:hypothetical protein [Enterococcus sp. DIV0756]|uniref:hypothetical protein n=1 Tax=Enterococcus sp. DIV0756 TaxID=2774636 RepID=UPI003F298357